MNTINIGRLDYQLSLKGITEADFLQKIGMSACVINKWRDGVRPLRKTLEKVAVALGVSTGYLISTSTELTEEAEEKAREERAEALERIRSNQILCDERQGMLCLIYEIYCDDESLAREYLPRIKRAEPEQEKLERRGGKFLYTAWFKQKLGSGKVRRCRMGKRGRK